MDGPAGQQATRVLADQVDPRFWTVAAGKHTARFLADPVDLRFAGLTKSRENETAANRPVCQAVWLEFEEVREAIRLRRPGGFLRGDAHDEARTIEARTARRNC